MLSAHQVQDKEGAGVRAWEKGDAFPGEAPLSEDHYPATATRGRIETFHQEDTGSPGASLSGLLLSLPVSLTFFFLNYPCIPSPSATPAPPTPRLSLSLFLC